MLEHLHPTVDGYFLLADAFYDALREAGAIGEWRQPVAEQAARRDLLLTPADSLVGLLRVRRMMSHWPFVPRGESAPRGDTLTVRTGFDRVVEALYRDAAPWVEATGELALYYEQAGDLRRAVQAREAVVASYPMFAQPYLGLAGVYLRANRLNEAERYFKEAAAREPRAAGPLSMLGVVELKRGNVAQAIGYLERARALDPRNVETLYNLSMSYAYSQRFAEARATVEALLRVQPGHAWGQALLASLSSANAPAGP